MKIDLLLNIILFNTPNYAAEQGREF